MSRKTLQQLIVGLGIAILSFYFILGAISLVITQSPNFGKELVTVGMDWAYAEIYNQSGDWCESPEQFDAEVNILVVNFDYDESLTVSSTGKDTAKITLEPEILMEAQSLQMLFHNFRLNKGEILDVILEDGSHFQIFVCGRKIYLIGPAFG